MIEARQTFSDEVVEPLRAQLSLERPVGPVVRTNTAAQYAWKRPYCSRSGLAIAMCRIVREGIDLSIPVRRIENDRESVVRVLRSDDDREGARSVVVL